ncbi:hypothetical protein SAMN05444414_1556 [Roseovarius marisflavi]|uniref:Uncharacterized protein n=1 Tax=Roseovarius marisflavi TaxID=1054996 RepID=A0A1M7DXH0_9RHOB|nr:hypothetical protein SAMN05444414_1556 [Roseovarius marisflavi]
MMAIPTFLSGLQMIVLAIGSVCSLTIWWPWLVRRRQDWAPFRYLGGGPLCGVAIAEITCFLDILIPYCMAHGNSFVAWCR